MFIEVLLFYFHLWFLVILHLLFCFLKLSILCYLIQHHVNTSVRLIVFYDSPSQISWVSQMQCHLNEFVITPKEIGWVVSPNKVSVPWIFIYLYLNIRHPTPSTMRKTPEDVTSSSYRSIVRYLTSFLVVIIKIRRWYGEEENMYHVAWQKCLKGSCFKTGHRLIRYINVTTSYRSRHSGLEEE